MKNITRFTIIAAAALTVAGCGSKERKKYLPGAHGGPYEIVVVAPPDTWTGQLGDTLRSVLQEPVPMLNSYEPQFDVRRVMVSQYSDYIRRHRNTIVLNVDPQYAEPRMVTEYNRYAAPQLILYLMGPGQSVLARYVHDNARYLRQIFNMAERDRFIGQSRQSPAVTLETLVKEKFGFEVSLLRGFTTGNDLDDFLWLRYEHPQSSQGMVIYSYPYAGPEDFTVEALTESRDRFAGLIPGEVEGSHMVTYREIAPELTHLRIRGRHWAEMRGFWDVRNDFMGGPFVSYSTVDAANNRVVCLDMYVYSPAPHKHKRNLIRQLESAVYSVRFPGDAATADDGEAPADSVGTEEAAVVR